MYDTRIKDATTITWHNLHFLLEHYTTEVLSAVEAVIDEGEQRITGVNTLDNKTQALQELRTEVVATVKTLKAIHTVVTHHRAMTTSHTNKETTL